MRINNSIWYGIIFLVMTPTLTALGQAGPIRKATPQDKEQLLNDIRTLLNDQTPAPLVDKLKTDLTRGDVFYHQLKSLLRASDLEPINIDYADALFYSFDSKISSIHSSHRQLLRDQKETRSVMVSIDSLKKLVDALQRIAIGANRKTGVRIVFGSYTYDGAATTQDKSGRMTVFLVGTIDTASKRTIDTKFDAQFQWDLHDVDPTYKIGLLFNHGDLCPNNCQRMHTKYKDH